MQSEHSHVITVLVLVGCLAALLIGALMLLMNLPTGAHNLQNQIEERTIQETVVTATSSREEVIILAGGCFWCTEAYLQETEGVLDAVSGYTGDGAETANYVAVSTGNTNHREAVQVTFDPLLISLQKVLDVYWAHIDPTDTDGQFADTGFQYTTAIYYSSPEQREVIEASKSALENSGLFDAPIATQVLPVTAFFEAEAYHQDFYMKSAEHYQRYKKASGRADFIEDNRTDDKP